MDERRYRIRDFVDADVPAYVALRNRLYPDFLLNEEEVRHWIAAPTGPHETHRLFSVQTVDANALVAVGDLEQHPFNYHPRKFWVEVEVDLDHQRQGIGTALFDRLEAEARAAGALVFWSGIRADRTEAVRFFQRLGFVEQRRVRRSRLDLAAPRVREWLERPRPPSLEGLRFTTLAEEGPAEETPRRRLYELVNLSAQDVPTMGEHTSATYEEFLRIEIDAPGHFPEGTFLAVDGDRYVGTTMLERRAALADLVHVAYTGTLREYRGRGIASELKRRAVAFSRAAGYRWMETGNDYANTPIWSINQRIGFETVETRIFGEKPLAPRP